MLLLLCSTVRSIFSCGTLADACLTLAFSNLPGRDSGCCVSLKILAEETMNLGAPQAADGFIQQFSILGRDSSIRTIIFLVT